jgi:tungstate transport system ATP-binding protein
VVPLLEVRNIAHTAPGAAAASPFVLNVPSLSVREGDRLVLLGPNGAGKSTLVRILSLIEKPASGTYFYRGEPVTHSRDAARIRRSFSALFQRPVVFKGTVEDNLRLALRLKGKPESGRVLGEALEAFELGALRDSPAGSLSGGEARKLSLAMALITEPEVLFLDEPTAFLDPVSRRSFEELMRRVLAERATTLVYVTHDRSEALSFGSRVALLVSGRIIQEGSVDEVFGFPASVEAAEITGSLLVERGVLEDVEDGLAAVRLPSGAKLHAVVRDGLSVGMRVAVVIRPDSVVIEGSSPGDASPRNTFEARVTDVRARDGVYEVFLDPGFPLRSFVTAQAVRELSLEQGRTVFASFKATAVRLIQCLEGGGERGQR